MFFHTFSKDQKLAFLALAHRLAAADEQIQAREQRYLALIKLEMGLEPEIALPQREPAALLAAFDSRGAKVGALLELLGVGYIDDELVIGERQLIGEIAAAFGVQEPLLRVMEQWVRRQRSLLREARSFETQLGQPAPVRSKTP